MNDLKLSLALIALTACTSGNHTPEVSITPELQPYVTQFQQDAIDTIGTDIQIDDLRMVMQESASSTEPYAIGMCTQFEGESPLIQISPSWWSHNLDTIQRKLLVYHELGHCVLQRMHNVNVISIMMDGKIIVRPVSIMYPIMGYMDDEYFNTFKGFILEEYFDSRRADGE